MACLGEDAVVAVGGEYDVGTGTFRGRIFLFRENSWQSVATEEHLPRLRRVRCTGDQLLICGDAGTAFRWNGSAAQRLNTRLRYDLHDLICTDGDRVLVCGDGGTLLQETDAETGIPGVNEAGKSPWRQISDGETNRTLRAIWAVGDGARRL